MVGTHAVTVGGVDISCLIDGASISHGRDNPGTQPEASSITVDFTTGPDDPLPPEVEIGAAVNVTTTTVLQTSQRFTGRVTDLVLGWDDAGEETPDAGTGQLTAVGILADLGRRVVGDTPYPAELDGARVSRVMTAAGITLNPAYSDPGTVTLLARDIDSQPALDVAQGAAASGSGVLWQTRAGEVRYADAAHRKGVASSLTLDACNLLVTPTWRRTIEGLVNEVSIGYGVAAGGGEQPRYTATEPVSVGKFGRYGYAVTTELAAVADATALGQLLLVRNSKPVWVMAALPIDVKGLTDAQYDALLNLDMHSLITLTGLPVIGAAPTSATLWVEGIKEGLAWDAHDIELVVSGYCRTAPAPRWDDVAPEWLWGGTVVTATRRNLATNPSGEGAGGWAANTPANHTISDDTSIVHGRGKSKRCTPQAPVIGASTSLLAMFNIGGNPWPATVGQAYTASAYLRSTAPAAKGQVGIQFLNAGGGGILTTLGPLVDLPPNEWVRASWQQTAPTDTVTMRVTASIQRQGGNVVAGELAWIDDCLVEAAASLGAYFDGATPDVPNALDYSWAGAADASASTADELAVIASGLPASLTWDDAACMGPPANLGRWNDQPASLRWDQIAPASTWNNYGG